MENVEKPDSVKKAAILRACSACAGDYEDPDGAAPLEDVEEAEEDPEEDPEPVPTGAEGFLNGERMPQE